MLNMQHNDSAVDLRGDAEDGAWTSMVSGSGAEDTDEDEFITIHDSIHGHVPVHPLLKAIIDTPEFDRLRSIRQLGSTHYVYPGGKHTRWEHSVGTSFLASKFLDAIEKKKPGSFTERDRLCVTIGALCHDLGHGPFSHMFEKFISVVRPGSPWTHETASIEIFQRIVDEQSDMFIKYGLNEQDITFIKEVIYGPLDGASVAPDQPWPYKGRDPSQAFLYEIVANKSCSIDVDKFDYLLRDGAGVNMSVKFDYRRFFEYIDLTDCGGRLRISMRDKIARNVQTLFEDRASLHMDVYQHKTVKIIDEMIVDALIAADKAYPLPGDIALSQAIDNLEVYLTLTDDVLLNTIKYSGDVELRNSKEIIQRIVRRKLYKSVGTIHYHDTPLTPGEVKEKMEEAIDDLDSRLKIDGIVIIRKKIDKGGDYSEDNLLFHDRDNRLINIPQKQLEMQLPRIHQISDLVVSKKIEDLTEVKKIYEKFAEFVKNSEDFEGTKKKFAEVVDSVKNTVNPAELRRILSEFITSELNESITCM